MASNFVPMLSASPPPLDDCPDDEDDEFGNFASANIPFDSSFDSPVASDKHKSYKPGDNGVNDVKLNNDFNAYCTFNDTKKQPLQNHKNELSHNQIFNNHVSKLNEDNKEEILVLNPPHKMTIEYVAKENIDKITDIKTDSPDFVKEEHFQEPVTVPLPLESTTMKDKAVDDAETNASYLGTSPTKDSIEVDELSSSTKPGFYQDNDMKPRGLFKNDNFPDFDAESDEAQNKESLQNCVKETIDSTENLSFPVNFEAADNSGHFQQNFQSQTQCSKIDSTALCQQNLALSQNEEKFETNFDNFKEFCDQDNKDEFDEFQSFTQDDPVIAIKNASDISKELSDDKDFQSLKKCETTDVESEEFDDFQGPVEVESKEFDDFQGPVDVDSEEFDDFQACSAPIKSDTQDFANFEKKTHSESSEFADFESASFSSVSDETPPSVPPQGKNIDKISTLINAIFPPVSDTGEEYCDKSGDPLKQNYKGHRLWEKLQEVEQAPSLRFQWGVSHSFQQLLRSVNVDYHSILRTSSVPIFASSLSLLEPVKGQTNSANAESEDRNQSPKAIDPIPPVEFDWTGSGLVNPLDSGQTPSVLMDLSFLAATDTASSSTNNNHSFENELLKPSPIPTGSINSKKTLILEELLSKNICSLPNSKTAHRPTNISEEANSVLDQLPDLSFMRAKVLMFPISSKT